MLGLRNEFTSKHLNFGWGFLINLAQEARETFIMMTVDDETDDGLCSKKSPIGEPEGFSPPSLPNIPLSVYASQVPDGQNYSKPPGRQQVLYVAIVNLWELASALPSV